MTPPEMRDGEVGSGLQWVMTAGLLGGQVLVLLCWDIADLAVSFTHCDTSFALRLFRITFINAGCVVRRRGVIGSVTMLVCAQGSQVIS